MRTKAERYRRRLRAWLIALGLFVAAATVVSYLTLPDVSVLKDQYPVLNPTQDGKGFTVSWSRKRPAHWVSLGAISRKAVGAVVVSEDWSFFSHPGYDAGEMRQALKEALKDGELGRGASTLTQQVVKNVFLSSERTLTRKLKELILATRLEKAVGKKKILEVYFNIAEWGRGIYGVQRAARHYFKKSPSMLTAKEGAFLAMLLPSPRRYGVSFTQGRLTPYAEKTIRRILKKMVIAGYLAPGESGAVRSAPLSFEAPPPEEPEEPGDAARDPMERPRDSEDDSEEAAEDLGAPTGAPAAPEGYADEEIWPDPPKPIDVLEGIQPDT